MEVQTMDEKRDDDHPDKVRGGVEPTGAARANYAVPEEDTEGQGAAWSNKDLKKDVKPIEPEKTPAAGSKNDDTEGHGSASNFK